MLPPAAMAVSLLNTGVLNRSKPSSSAIVTGRSVTQLPVVGLSTQALVSGASTEINCPTPPSCSHVTITLAVTKGHGAYATKKAISLVNEIFHGFLRGPYYEYMVENFNEPEE